MTLVKVALRGMNTRRLRTALTAFAIVLGVAMVAAAFTVGDTMRQGADSLSAAAYDGTDAVVSAPSAFQSDVIGQADTIPAATLERVRSVPGVGVAAGDVLQEARLIDKDGKALGDGPYFAVGYDSSSKSNERLSPFHLKDGRWATSPSEVVIDAGTARKKGFAVGDGIDIAAHGPRHTYRVVGIARFGDVETLGTATAAVFDLKAAQSMFAGHAGGYDDILVAAAPGTSPQQLRANLHAAFPQLSVRTAEAHDRFTLDGLKQFISIIKTVLLVFGFIAIFVGAFTIYNTLSITVAQRARELATLRTVGASRRQVLGSVVTESAVVAVAGSAVGVLAGFGLGSGLLSLLSSLGIDLPRTSTVFATHTIVVAGLVGLIVTMVSGLVPALRATRVAPVTLLREGAELNGARRSRKVAIAAFAITAIALAILGYALFAGGIKTTDRLIATAPGGLLLFVGVAMLSNRFARPLASLLGRPGQRIGGVAGGLARRNAMRNPSRTSATAAALMIGVALVTFVAVFGAGIKSAAKGEIADKLAANYVVAPDGWAAVSSKALDAAGRVPGVTVTSGVRQSFAKVGEDQLPVDGVDTATVGQVLNFSWKKGAATDISKLGPGDAVVRDEYAKDHHLKVGSRVTLTSPSAKHLTVTIRGIEKTKALNASSAGIFTIPVATFDRTFAERNLRLALVDAPSSSKAALERALRPFPDVKLQDRGEYEDSQLAWINSMLAIFYVLLALTVIVSLFGIVNTLVLSVMERTREVGMLRAIGMTRRQTRRMVRHEGIVTAQLGAVTGMAIGILLGGAITFAMRGIGMTFTLPIGSLVAFAVVATLAGMLAAALPARRAARMPVLDALSYE
jgi:putative ABC transport system permease protein